MTQLKKGIEIVQYHEGLANGVAKMWNLSRDGWGGDTRIMTEEQVKQKEANSDNIALYLALDGEEVVGYCGLSEYKEDIGSLYIPLLNVRPDYQSQKIGKKLLLHALEKTIELGWPRLDLYTWPGNTKAVPLYKKCGFFWEDRDDVTHLMNFIPQVLKTPLLTSVFEELNWYDSSERQIEVKPDGTKENGFTYYEYSWKNDNKFARIQFERSGRGIHLIETDEFLLKLNLDDHEVIEQEQQTFSVTFVNKTKLPVSLKLNGSSNERVQYHLSQEQMVDTEAIITGNLTITPGEEPSAWRTHPTIALTVAVNGKECELKLGVFPVQPAKLEANYEGNLCFLNNETSIELEVKNNLKENVEYTIQFPENNQVLLEKNQYSVPVTANGRNTISIPIDVQKHGFFNPTLTVQATKSDGTTLTFEQKICVAFKGFGEKFGGESKDYWHIFNGLCQVNIRKRDLLTTVAKNNKRKQPLAFLPPKLGKPYSNEFTKKIPLSVLWDEKASSIVLKMKFESGEKAGIELTKVMELFADGIFQKWVEVENKGSTTFEEIAVSAAIFHEMKNTYFPLADQVVSFNENRFLEFGDLSPSSITGNWYFSENTLDPLGVCWSTLSKAAPEGWQFIIEDELGRLEPGGKKSSEKVTLSVGAFKNWEDFRAYATQSNTVEKIKAQCEHLFEAEQMIVDPNSDVSFSFHSFRNSYLDGQLQISMNENEIYQTTISSDEEKNCHIFQYTSAEDGPISIIKGEYRTNGITSQVEELVLCPSNTEINQSSYTDHQFEILEASNGCITLKAAPSFYPGLYSLKVNETEWLDTSFPTITPKSWWNPWAGGMKTAPTGVTTFSLLKELNTAYPVELLDDNGNQWSGLGIRTEMTDHPDWKGLRFEQYYLMLPGVPVVATFIDVKSTGGKNLDRLTWETELFVGDLDLPNIKLHTNENKLTKHYTAGVQALPLHYDLGNYFYKDSKKDKFFLVPNLYCEHDEVYTNKHALAVHFSSTSLPGEKGKKTAPLFMVFDERDLNDTLLEKLRRIQFS